MHTAAAATTAKRPAFRLDCALANPEISYFKPHIPGSQTMIHRRTTSENTVIILGALQLKQYLTNRANLKKTRCPLRVNLGGYPRIMHDIADSALPVWMLNRHYFNQLPR
jgi:hypothetical protein